MMIVNCLQKQAKMGLKLYAISCDHYSLPRHIFYSNLSIAVPIIDNGDGDGQPDLN